MLTKALGAGGALIIATALATSGGPYGASPAAAAISPPATPAAKVGPARLGSVPAGQRPPQVVVVAFDDSGNTFNGTAGHFSMFDYWLSVARDYDTRMTFFLSGTQLLTSQTQHTYDAPQWGPANMNMGMLVPHIETLPGQSETDALRQEMTDLKRAHAEGNEIGTHFMGHICGSGKGSVGSFSQADWEQDLQQFYKAVDNANTTNHLNPPIDLGFKGEDVVGDRTPCLEGNFHNLYPVIAKHGFTYETSPTPEIRWPYRGASDTGPSNLWVFPLATVPMYGSSHYDLDMDWNICDYHEKDCLDAPVDKAAAARWSQQALDTYRTYFEKSYTGDRAPLFIGDHFEMWHNGAYTRALTSFVKETCNKPEVRCVSYQEAASWLNTTPTAQLDTWRTGAFPHYTDANPPAYGSPVPDVLMPTPWPAKAEPAKAEPAKPGQANSTPPGPPQAKPEQPKSEPAKTAAPTPIR
jgi:hypothetical protein